MNSVEATQPSEDNSPPSEIVSIKPAPVVLDDSKIDVINTQPTTINYPTSNPIALPGEKDSFTPPNGPISVQPFRKEDSPIHLDFSTTYNSMEPTNEGNAFTTPYLPAFDPVEPPGESINSSTPPIVNEPEVQNPFIEDSTTSDERKKRQKRRRKREYINDGGCDCGNFWNGYHSGEDSLLYFCFRYNWNIDVFGVDTSEGCCQCDCCENAFCCTSSDCCEHNCCDCCSIFDNCCNICDNCCDLCKDCSDVCDCNGCGDCGDCSFDCGD